MAKAISAGLLLFRRRASSVEVLLVHPGGPFWAKKDEGAWSIPKGEHDARERPFAAAKREFFEELGSHPPEGDPIDLGELSQAGGKRVHAFALEGDLDASDLRSNTFEMQWPPRSGKLRTFPEVDRAEWFDLASARVKLLSGQRRFVDLLAERLG